MPTAIHASVVMCRNRGDSFSMTPQAHDSRTVIDCRRERRKVALFLFETRLTSAHYEGVQRAPAGCDFGCVKCPCPKVNTTFLFVVRMNTSSYCTSSQVLGLFTHSDMNGDTTTVVSATASHHPTTLPDARIHAPGSYRYHPESAAVRSTSVPTDA